MSKKQKLLCDNNKRLKTVRSVATRPEKQLLGKVVADLDAAAKNSCELMSDKKWMQQEMMFEDERYKKTSSAWVKAGNVFHKTLDDLTKKYNIDLLGEICE